MDNIIFIKIFLNAEYFLHIRKGKYHGIYIPVINVENIHNITEAEHEKIFECILFTREIINKSIKEIVCYSNKKFYKIKFDSSLDNIITTKKLPRFFRKINSIFFTVVARYDILLNSKTDDLDIKKNYNKDKYAFLHRFLMPISAIISTFMFIIFFPNSLFRIFFTIPLFITSIVSLKFSKSKSISMLQLYLSFLYRIENNLQTTIENSNAQKENFYSIYLPKKFINSFLSKIQRFYLQEKIYLRGKYAYEYSLYITMQLFVFHNLNYFIDKDNAISYMQNKNDKNIHNEIMLKILSKNSQNFCATKIIKCDQKIKDFNFYMPNALFKLGIKNSTPNRLPIVAKFQDNITFSLEDIRNNWDKNIFDLSAPCAISKESIYHLNFNNTSPHALISGSTGSGKSEALVTIILSLCIKYSPKFLKFILVDYKGGSTFKALENLPHVENVYTDINQNSTMRAIEFIKIEIQKRSAELAKYRVKNIDEYNNFRTNENNKLPKLLIIIDEFLSLSSQNSQIINSLIDVTTKGRALGIYMLLATQNTSSNIPKEIKTNISTQIYMDKNEYDLHFVNKPNYPKIAGRANIDGQEIQFLWIGHYHDSLFKTIIYNVNDTYKEYNNKNTVIIVPPSLPKKLYFANNIIYSNENKKIWNKETLFNKKCNEIIIGIADLKYDKKQIPFTLKANSHNFSIPNYSITKYIANIIFQSALYSTTYVFTQCKEKYEFILGASFLTNIVYIDLSEMTFCYSVLEKITNTHTINFPNIIFDCWEDLQENIQIQKLDYKNKIIKTCLDFSKKYERKIIIFSKSPISGFNKYYFFETNNWQDSSKWQQYVVPMNTQINATNDIKNTETIKGRITTDYNNHKIQIQLIENKYFHKNKLTILKKKYLSEKDYAFKTPQLFIYNKQQTLLESKNNNKCNILFGIEKLSLKHIYLPENKTYTIFHSNKSEKEKILKIFFNLTNENSLKEFYENHILTTQVNELSLKNIFIENNNNIYCITDTTENILDNYIDAYNKKALHNTAQNIHIKNVIDSFKDEDKNTDILPTNKITKIIFVDKTNYKSIKNYTEKMQTNIFSNNEIKLFFHPDAQEMQILYPQFSESKIGKNIIYDKENDPEILVIYNNKYSWIKLVEYSD